MQPEAQYVLQAAARRAYGADSQVKYRLAQKLLNSMTHPNDPSTATSFTLDEAASICHVPASALLAVLRPDSSFKVKQSSSGSYSIRVDAAALLQKGRSSTKAGILVEELPEPVGWVDDRHPVRPGRPMCYHWHNYGRCAFGGMCVYNHPEEARAALKGQAKLRQQSPSPTGFPDLISNTQHNTPRQRSSQHTRKDAWSAQAGFAGDSVFEKAAGFDDVDAHAAVVLPPSSESAQFAGYAAVAPGQQQQQQQQGEVPTVVPAAVQSGSTTARPPSGGPSRPGAAVCRLFQIRGFCPQGDRCHFDHPTTESSAAPAAVASAAVLPVQQPETQQQVQALPAQTVGASAASSRSTSILPASLQQQQQQETDEWENWVDDNQQVPQKLRSKSNKQHKRRFPFLGVNEHGYPMFRGAPNCHYYLGAGRCDFSNCCKFHHPPDVFIPEGVLKGTMSRRFDVSQSAPYSRLVSHLQRLWDYESCDEARLKVWLAHHLLARENTDCSMFSPDASRPAVEEDSPAVPTSADKPLGAYSCTLNEAAQVLQLLWKAQPDESASEPMPYTGKLGTLLGGDAYLQLCDGPDGRVLGMKLKVQEINKLLNF